MSAQRITEGQIRFIHTAASLLGLGEEVYREMLAGHGVSSSTELSFAEASLLCHKFSALLDGKPLPTSLPKKRKGYGTKRHGWGKQTHQDLAEREQRGKLATPKQLRLIEALWREHPAVQDKSDKGLEGFCERITGIAKLRWLTHQDVQKLIKGIENLKTKKKEENES